MESENKIKPAKSEGGNRVVQTYADDMASVLENDTEGLVKKIIHGEEEHELEKKNLSPESKKNKTFMLISFLLIFLALIILSFFFLRKTSNTVSVEPQFTPIIFNDKLSNIEVLGLGKDQIAEAVLNKVNTTEVKTVGLEGLYLSENKQFIGLRRFISIIKSSFVPDVNPLLVSDNFLMGVVNVKAGDVRASGEGFFILLKVRSTADIFDALRAWEGKMFLDLHGFLGIALSSDTSYLLTKGFEDGIENNKNARILYDKDGKIALMYVFADENSVIITNSENAVREIMLRLASSQKKQ